MRYAETLKKSKIIGVVSILSRSERTGTPAAAVLSVLHGLLSFERCSKMKIMRPIAGVVGYPTTLEYGWMNLTTGILA